MTMKTLALFILLAVSAFARPNYSSWCQLGNRTVSVPGQLPSTTRVQQSFPSCTVTVRDSMGNIASIFSDNVGTVLANPFVATASGLWNFYADADHYSVQLSGGGIPAPFTILVTLSADTSGINSLNGLTAATQTFAAGTSGSDFGISSATATHTFNLPTASASNRGALSSADWSTFNGKQDALMFTSPLMNTAGTVALTLPITIAQGGHGQTTQTTGFNALSPLTTKGDIVVHDGTNNVRLAVGGDTQCLSAASGQPTGLLWTTCGVGTVTHTGALVTGRMVVGNGTADVTQGTLADETNNNASTSAHGFVKKLPGTATLPYCGDGNFATTCQALGYTTLDIQTGTSYTILAADCQGYLTFNNGSAISATLPQANTGGNFLTGCWIDVKDLGAGTVTITPATSTIDGGATATRTTGKSFRIVSVGGNYITLFAN